MAVSVVDATGFELEGVPLLPVQVGRTDTHVTRLDEIPPAAGEHHTAQQLKWLDR